MVDKLEMTVGHWPPAQTARVRRRVVRALKIEPEQLKKAEEYGWEFWRSLRVMPGQVLARKNGDNARVYGPITSHEDILELLVNDRMGHDG